MAQYTQLTPPTSGEKIRMNRDMTLSVPDNPILPFIEGDGTGPDIWRASQRVFDAAVQKAYGGKKKITLEVVDPRWGTVKTETRTVTLP